MKDGLLPIREKTTRCPPEDYTLSASDLKIGNR